MAAVDAPERHGVSSDAILRFLDAAQQRIDAVHSLVLVRHGRTIARGWWYPYQSGHLRAVQSVTKSFTATAVGLAVAEGLLALDDRLVSIAPEPVPKRLGHRAAALTVRHLLTMTVGHHEDRTHRIFGTHDGDLIKTFLSLPVEHEPGGYFVYNTAASCVLAAVVRRVTGVSPLEYLRPRLFAPLGITNVTWASHPNGTNYGGFGLSLTTDDLAKFGQLYLQGGVWEGRRVLPADWVEAATARQVATVNPAEVSELSWAPSPPPEPDPAASDWAQGYGYQFWRSRHGYRADGAFGQYCLVMPEHDAVLAITSGVRDMAVVFDLVWECLLPAMGTAPLPPDRATERRLRDRLSNLRLPALPATTTPAAAEAISGRPFRVTGGKSLAIRLPPPLGDARPRLRSVTFDFGTGGDTCRITFTTSGGRQELLCGMGEWRTGSTVPSVLAAPSAWTSPAASGPDPVAACAAWLDERTFAFRVCLCETSHITTHICRLGSDVSDFDTLAMEAEDNASFGPTHRTTITARRAVRG